MVWSFSKTTIPELRRKALLVKQLAGLIEEMKTLVKNVGVCARIQEMEKKKGEAESKDCR